MRELIITLLTCSVTMSVVALFYMAVTPILAKRYSARGRYYAWLIVVIGLIIPFRPQWDNAIIKVSVPVTATAKAPPIIHNANSIPVILAETNTVSERLPSVSSISLWQIIALVWFTGMFITISYHAIRHYRFTKTAQRWSENITDEPTLILFQSLKTEMGISQHIGLYLCSTVGSPMLVGFITPRILLPLKNLSQDELCFILKHELVHYKRKDLYYKCAVLLAACIHWFNPIVYMIAKTIDIGCEISCDDEIIRSTGVETRRHYSETIIGVVRHQSKLKTALSTNFYGGKNSMSKRIFSIMDTGKKKAGAIIICVTLIATLGTGAAFASNAAESASSAASASGGQEYVSIKQEPSPEYERLGISYNEDGKMLFDGKTVRYFWDGFYVDYPSYATIYDYLNAEGVVDIHTVRSVIDNGDGSYNPHGELLDIVAYSQQEFDARDIDWLKRGSTTAQSSDEVVTQEEGGTGIGSVSALSGLENGSVGNGRTIAEIMKDYEVYGIEYERRTDGSDNMGNIYYNGQLVKTFVNVKNDGGIYTFSSVDGGDISVRTMYDINDKLTGVEVTNDDNDLNSTSATSALAEQSVIAVPQPQSIKTVNLTIENCNVSIQFSDDEQFKYDNNEIFKIMPIVSGFNVDIEVELAEGHSASLTDMAVIYLPDLAYENVTVKGNNAGIGLPALYANLSLTNKGGAIGAIIPEGFDKSIDFTINEGSGSLNLHENAEDYFIEITPENSSVSLPLAFPPFNQNSTWEYQVGNGTAKISINLTRSAFALRSNELN